MKKIPKKLTIINIIILIICIALSLIYKFPLYLALLATAIYTFIVLLIYEYKLKTMIKQIIENIKLISNILILLSFIGILVPLLIQIGTLPNFIYFSISTISSSNILVFAFIISLILSMLLGSAIGTLTILVPLFLSVSISIQIPVEYVIGALVSGSYFGDRTSPLASSAHLTAAVTKSPVRKNIRLMLLSSIIPLILSLILYYLLGKNFEIVNIQNIENLKYAISNNFAINWLYLLPIAILISLILIRVPIILSLFIVYLISFFIYLIQGFNFNSFIDFTLNGYSNNIPILMDTLKSSGILQMINLFLIIFASAILNSLLEIGHMLDDVLKPLIKNAKTYAQLTRKTAFLSIILSLITCNQTLTSIITGKYMISSYNKLKINRSYLANTIGNTGMNIVALIPWNVNGLLVATLTGVPTLLYAKYAFFTILLPVFSILIYPIINNRKQLKIQNNKYQ